MLEWMKSIHSEGMNGGMFFHFKIYKVLHDQGGAFHTRSIFCRDHSHINTYFENMLLPLLAAHRTRFLNKHLAL